MYLLVLFTGPETKLILNHGNYRFKQSHVDKMINVVMLWNALVMMALVLIMTLLNFQWTEDRIAAHRYVFEGS